MESALLVSGIVCARYLPIVDLEKFLIVFPLEVFERKERVVGVLVTGVHHPCE